MNNTVVSLIISGINYCGLLKMTVPSIRNSDPINTMCYLILNINELFCYDDTTVNELVFCRVQCM